MYISRAYKVFSVLHNLIYRGTNIEGHGLIQMDILLKKSMYENVNLQIFFMDCS